MRAKKNVYCNFFCDPHILFSIRRYKKIRQYYHGLSSQINTHWYSLYHATVKNTFNYNYIMGRCCDFLCVEKKRREFNGKKSYFVNIISFSFHILYDQYWLTDFLWIQISLSTKESFISIVFRPRNKKTNLRAHD